MSLQTFQLVGKSNGKFDLCESKGLLEGGALVSLILNLGSRLTL